jgi:hypothetical protein
MGREKPGLNDFQPQFHSFIFIYTILIKLVICCFIPKIKLVLRLRKVFYKDELYAGILGSDVLQLGNGTVCTAYNPVFTGKPANRSAACVLACVNVSTRLAFLFTR